MDAPHKSLVFFPVRAEAQGSLLVPQGALAPGGLGEPTPDPEGPAD